MKRYACLFGVTALLLVAADDKDDAKKELERFQGTWKIESVEMDEAKLDPKMFKDAQLVIMKDGEFSFKEGDRVSKGTFKVDKSKKPNTIDITYTEGLKATFVGIYELDGDTFKVCLDPTGKNRPTKFESKKGTGHVMEVLKREKK
jgi:uncharacterized protein (TIGR03067 family)